MILGETAKLPTSVFIDGYISVEIFNEDLLVTIFCEITLNSISDHWYELFFIYKKNHVTLDVRH